MALTHTLTYNNSTSVIDEPIGWDNFSVHLQRHDYHGIGAEVSMDTLEFYGRAYTKIKNAYTEDIDSEVVYTIKDENNVVLYTGRVDLSTCSFINGDYQSVKAKVGEIGSMTTFNNRVDKDVDIDDPKTIDGSAVTAPDWLSLHIPMKHLLYTNNVKQTADQRQPESGTFEITSRIKRYVFIPFGDEISTEFGNISSPVPYAVEDVDLEAPQYIAGDDFEDKFGTGTTMNFEARLVATLTFDALPHGPTFYRLFASDDDGNTISGAEKWGGGNNTYDVQIDASVAGTLSAGGNVKYWLRLTFDQPGSVFNPNLPYNSYVTVKKGTYVKMTMYDNLADDSVKSKMLLVHDALNVVSHAISENALSVKSEWYQTPECSWNASSIPTGGSGALKALTNGYFIRNLFTDDENKRNMPVSFKALIESLDAIDCIGWGFSTEDNVLYLRVERWDWFYNDTTILTLTNVAEVTTDVYTDCIPTELKIGYKKYATQDQYNSIDSPHGTRTFVNGIKAVSKAITKECEFVADNYAIEETRRARTQSKETEETTYDENIFVFELVRTSRGVMAVYKIDNTATDAQDVGRASEFINAKLTPRHMAARWRDYIFATNNITPFRFTSGEINYKSSFSVIPASSTSAGTTTQSLKTMDVTSPQVENDDISYIHAKFKAEKITFSYPLTISQYRYVKANPYGLVSVNGTLGWILDFKYSLADGMADFVLIAKNS